MVELGIKIRVSDYENKGEYRWFDFDNKRDWDNAWEYMYVECRSGFIQDATVDYFESLEVGETTEINDIYETYMLMDKLSENERNIVRGIYDDGEWSGSLNDLLTLFVRHRL